MLFLEMKNFHRIQVERLENEKRELLNELRLVRQQKSLTVDDAPVIFILFFPSSQSELSFLFFFFANI